MPEEWVEAREKLLIKKYERDGRIDAQSMKLGDSSGAHDHMWIDGKEVGYHPPKKP